MCDQVVAQHRASPQSNGFEVRGARIATVADGSAARIEARFRRGVLRELAQQNTGPSGANVRWFDDPWTCLDHLQDLWAHFAGLPPEADLAPDVTHRGWMRLTVADAEDANRSRWRTDPTWETVQRACFLVDASPAALTRMQRVRHDLAQVDAELYGLLKLHAVLRGEYLDTTATLSQELRAFADEMDEVDAKRGRDFAETVVEAGGYIRRPAVFGAACQIRHGAYVRGTVLAGDRCVIGHATEVTRSILLDRARAPHFAYVADSIPGNRVNLGAGTRLAN
jgi:hypothetical protein